VPAFTLHLLPPDVDLKLAALTEPLADSLGPHPDAAALAANDLEFHRRISAYSGDSALSSLLDILSGAAARATIWRGLPRRAPNEGWPSTARS
jgi:GntR family transcriptional regulator, transcriptional repressor for pyruvate dehydrogenase complex